MKTVKQRFSIWFSKSHQRYGTLWADRFKSVLVEGSGNPLQTMAAYIDLNPVRAGIVDDPKDYRFCGYAEAVAHSSGSSQTGDSLAADSSAEYVRGFVGAVQRERRRKFPPAVNPLKGAAWGDMAIIQNLRRDVFS